MSRAPGMTVLTAALALAGFAGPAAAAGPELPIHTASDAGSYHTKLCPPLAQHIKDNQQFLSPACTPSAGSAENYGLVQQTPGALGLAQFDVIANLLAAEPEEATPPVSIVERTGVRECLFAVSNAETPLTFKDIREAAAVAAFHLPPEGSGSAATFAFMQSLHPDDLGAAFSVTHEADTMEMLRAVAQADQTVVGLFVQFPDLSSKAFEYINKAGLQVIGVGSRAMSTARVADQRVYTVQEVATSEGGWFSSAETARTMCTEVVIIAANPEAVSDVGAGKRLALMTKALDGFDMAEIAAADDRDWLARMLDSAKEVTGPAAESFLTEVEEATGGML
ncbi:hypothetical protein [Rhodospira trueperi]|uniref:TRAP-type C4-dicarboxylate transport system, substrate-binding protein n=1 Tax=Rhodospira trueperi TaxID=69960 RepID=A0A1G7HF22_9PROT|nr:hypothetical protein [Rhodospira trueperi]SDE98946.1 hypothetical protein SAMN05421720_12027 [Rhodospira trueperi]